MQIVKFSKELREEEGTILTPESLFEKVDQWLTSHFPEYAEACKELDYKNHGNYHTGPGMLLYGDNYPEPNIRLVTGGSEGIYIDYGITYSIKSFPAAAKYVINEDGEPQQAVVYSKAATYKTLNEGPEAYGKMGLIVGYLTYATELYFMVNDDLIKKQNE